MRINRHSRRYFTFSICLALFCFAILLIYMPNHHPKDITATIYYILYPNESIGCFRYKKPLNTLPNINNFKMRPNRSIFFHETSCKSEFATLNARQACAVESAARINPNFDVFVTFSQPGTQKPDYLTHEENDRVTKALDLYPNIRLVHLNFEEFTRNTSLEQIYKTGKLEHSSFAVSHSSDILRYLTLYKYGGIYMDLDVLVIRSLEELPLNYAGAESDYNVAAGVLSFDSDGEGHKLALRCIKDLETNYRSHDWGNNGPKVVTRLFKKLCNAEYSKEMVEGDCGPFKVFPKSAFYPVRWEDWHLYFNSNNLSDVVRLFNDTYVLHVWNKFSVHVKTPVNVRTPYTVFAKKFCPRVFNECRQYF